VPISAIISIHEPPAAALTTNSTVPAAEQQTCSSREAFSQEDDKEDDDDRPPIAEITIPQQVEETGLIPKGSGHSTGSTSATTLSTTSRPFLLGTRVEQIITLQQRIGPLSGGDSSAQDGNGLLRSVGGLSLRDTRMELPDMGFDTPSRVIDFPGGQSFQGWLDGKGNRHGIMIYPDGSLYAGSWNQDEQRHGQGRCLFGDGSFYKGEFAHGQFQGQGIMIWSDGAYYMGDWCRDLMHGHGMNVLPNDEIQYQGLWKKGVPAPRRRQQPHDC